MFSQANRSSAASSAGDVVGGLLVFLLFSSPLPAQNRGQADIAIQGYYLGGNSQPLFDTTGVAVRFQDFLPGLGTLNGSLEAYGTQNRFQTGENFLELQGVPWLGRHWTLTGGDFHAPASLVEFPFFNIFNPEITARGIQLQASHDGTAYSFFIGEETLTSGPRIPYRILVPQTVAGASAVRKLGRNFTLGARLMQFSASPAAIAANPYLFPPGRDLGLVRTAALQSLYTPVTRLKIYAEVSRPLDNADGTIISTLSGVSYVTSQLTVRANYASQSASYFPLAGYFAGDRQGPFGELRFHPRKWIEFFGSASRYRSNLEDNPAVTFLASTSTATGVTANLPGRLSASGQISTVRFASSGGGQDPQSSYNRQLAASLGRTLGRHTLEATWRQIGIDAPPAVQRQTSTEIGDNFQVRGFSLGAAARLQQTAGSQRLNTMFYRGSAQGTLGRLSLFANLEIGDDLVNQTVFSTSAYSTTVAGAGLRLSRDWNLQAEAFRSRINVDLNPENIFLLQGGGIPLPQSLAGIEQWSLFVRISRQVRWNGGLPNEATGRAVAVAVPLAGSVEGFVRIKRFSGESPAPAIPLTLDGTRSTTTGPDGRYRFDNVDEGEHAVALDASALSAEYDPGLDRAKVIVQPRRIARADLDVLPLTTLEGLVSGPEGALLEGIVIRILPGSRYTMTGPDGHFSFYNVREGDWEIALDPRTLPEKAELRSPASLPAAIRIGTPTPPFRFQFDLPTTQKPIRKVLDKK